MIVVTDTSPLRYLIVLGLETLLPRLYGRVLCPQAVLAECRHPNAPLNVRQWVAKRDWVDYDQAVSRLKQDTNFRIAPQVIEIGRRHAYGDQSDQPKQP